MTSTLFILLKSPYEYRDLNIINMLKGDRSGVILFEDATLFSVYSERRTDLLKVVDRVFVIDDDLEARGFKGKAGEGTEVIDYPHAIDLIMDGYDQTITL
ncbi:MAG: sulfurtransferase complex subunit TusB [Candidatus Methanogranum gryphiswaldense]|nr:MAG: sulfurtransferase complex subunit TusB [Candidatus Methanogranum sp. U3.2.1]